MTRVKPEVRNPPFRKVKCDESRPACKRCTSTGRICDGYEPAANQTVQAPPVAQPLGVQTDAREIRSIQFFIEKSVKQLTTLFQDEWWNTQILQLAYSESSIRHALVALSTYHEQFTRRQAGSQTLFATRQQNLAIRDLMLPTQQPLTHVHLVTCCIFICIEILQGNHDAAIRFFKHGHKMLQELQQQIVRRASEHEPSSDVGTSLRYMETLFTRLAIQVSMLVGDVYPELSLALLGNMYSIRPSPQGPINSLLEARRTLTDLIVYSMQAIMGNVERRQYVKGCVKSWLDSFHEFRDRQPQIDADRRGSALLDLHANFLLLNLDMAGSESVEETLLKQDKYIESFQKLVKNAPLAMGERAAEQDPVFHLELGVVPLLYSVVANCRHPVIRRQAIHLLKTQHVQEGVWSSDLTSRVAERVLELEEAGRTIQQSSDILAAQRITSVVVHMEEGRKRANVIYRGQSHERSELIEW